MRRPQRRHEVKLHLFLAFLLVGAGVSGGKGGHAAEPVAADHAEKMTLGRSLFQEHVRGILIKNCLHCHGDGDIESNFDLTTREALLQGGDSGEPGVTPGDAKSSLIYRLITHQDEPTMPQEASKLKPDDIKHIARWIELGAPYDKPLIEKRDATPWTERIVSDEAKEYWAFRPLQTPSVPEVTIAGWGRTPVDRFIAAKLADAKLEPNTEADKRTLLRRAFFDLLGIPPTVAETEAFMADRSPEAYDSLIDRLLASPHFGERWARHWLDVARFAESHGFEQDYDRPHAYHYRDFVIKAFNSDMPYTQFVRWQLAGDELAPDEPLALMATGFLGAGPYPTQITLREVEPSRYDALDDMANTTGQAFLAMTIGCARCHDHKFDPIPQADYYRFASTFTTTVRSNIDVVLKPVDPAEQRQYDDKTRQLADALAAYERDQEPSRIEQVLQEGALEDRTDGAWEILEWQAQSTGGATLTALGDGSFVVSGPNPVADEYHFSADTQSTGLTALRVEALAHSSLTRNGPGRADNGNFCLSTITVSAESLVEPSKRIEVPLVSGRATHQQNQKGLSVAASLDDKEKTGWAVDLGGIGKNQAAEFRFAHPVGFPGGTRLNVRMVFAGNPRHSVGRPRLSITSALEPLPLEEGAPPVSLEQVLDGIDRSVGFASLPADRRAALVTWHRGRDSEWNRLHDALDAHRKSPPRATKTQVMVASEGVKPMRHHMPDGAPDFFRQTYYLKRGDTQQKAGEAPSSYLQVLMRAPEKEAYWHVTPPPGSRKSHRRHAMANWIVDTDHGAGHLLARVIVNRLWQHHFGRGLVATSNDFGKQAEPPSHPELLDYLAGELIRQGWRLKPIHKLLMSSAAYRQSSTFDESKFHTDNTNRLVWRFEPRRLESEAIRDSLLAVTGTLDDRMYGPGTLDEGMKRRSIYFTVKRSQLTPTMQLFDAPESLVTIGERGSTTIGPQALWFLNNPHLRAWVSTFAGQVKPTYRQHPRAAVRHMYMTALSREPDDTELKLGVQFVEQQMQSYQEAKRPNALDLALTDYCQAIVSLNEFVYVQ